MNPIYVNMSGMLMISALAARLSANEHKGTATIGERTMKLAWACESWSEAWAADYDERLKAKLDGKTVGLASCAWHTADMKVRFSEIERIADSMGLKAWVGDGERDLCLGTDGIRFRVVEMTPIAHHIGVAVRKARENMVAGCMAILEGKEGG